MITKPRAGKSTKRHENLIPLPVTGQLSVYFWGAEVSQPHRLRYSGSPLSKRKRKCCKHSKLKASYTTFEVSASRIILGHRLKFVSFGFEGGAADGGNMS
jgi:hypothetical protein